MNSPKPDKNSDKPTKRVRLSPDVRKQMILDCAADLVAHEGVSAVSMERLGRQAGISKSLVYNYFPSLTDVLQTLLKREYRTLRGSQIDAAELGTTFEQMVEKITGAYMNYMQHRGLLLERLEAEPNVSGHGDPTKYNRDRAVNHLAEILHDHFDLEMDLAKAAVDISFGLPAAGGHYLIRQYAPSIQQNDTRSAAAAQQIEALTTEMILGSIQAVINAHTNTKKDLRTLKLR